MEERPERIPAWGFAPEPYHVIALYRAFLWVWPWGQALGELERLPAEAADGRGSNAWVVGPARTAGGAALALIDPHLAWAPQNRFHEAHVRGPGLAFYGFSIPGTPFMAVGHTDVFSLALTTGGPDCADVYEERIHPEDPLLYEYDGQWLPVAVTSETILVSGSDGPTTEQLRIERTRHGPIVRRDGARAFSVRTAYDDEVGVADQWLRMIRAHDLEQFVEAMAALQAPPQNVLYADVHGRTYYVRTGRVPVRPAGFRWDRPVPGWTPATEWHGLHAFPELVQIADPAGGFLQNCNNSPDVTMPASPLTPEGYLDYLYNVRPQRWNTRGRRAFERLAALPHMTLDDARRLAVDTFVVEAPHWQRQLAQAWSAYREGHPALGPAVERLLAWDGRMDVASRGATLFRFWMRAARREGSGLPLDAIGAAAPLAGDAARALLDALAAAVEELRAAAGTLDLPWGRANRAGRGEASWPVAGCSADGIDTLRSVRSSAPGTGGVSQVTGGQLCTTVVVLDPNGVRSFSATPFGQSSDPGSRHYTDQGRRLFSRGRLKPTWYGPRALRGHVESRRTFLVPEGALALDGVR
jgi:acyl-homoserine-lactone acylase